MNCPTNPTVSILKEKETDSTNNRLAQLCDRENIKEFTTLLVDKQTAGKGQRGNSWESAPAWTSLSVPYSILSPKSPWAIHTFHAYRLVRIWHFKYLCRRFQHQMAKRHLLERQENMWYSDRKWIRRSVSAPLHCRYRRKYQPRAFCLPAPTLFHWNKYWDEKQTNRKCWKVSWKDCFPTIFH